VSSHPLAGTVALGGRDVDPTTLHSSAKDLEEHQLVVEDIAARLAPLVATITVPTTPSLVALRDVAHLGTSIVATTEDGGPSALSLLRAIHPTPAIGGVERDAAIATIARLETHDRGLFGGAVGWGTSDGDGEWLLAIRGALVHGARIEVAAGAGIVPASNPAAEAEETRVKLASILEALAPGSAARLTPAAAGSAASPSPRGAGRPTS
jgi:isochorismate synthase EntC